MFRWNKFSTKDTAGLVSSRLYNEQSFYSAFIADASKATEIIIIESPFITYRRVTNVYPVLQKAASRGVRIVINTRDPNQHEGIMRQQALDGIAVLQELGIELLYTVNLHRKLVIIDNRILWEGSMNVLSQNDSCELMRRTDSPGLAVQLIRFIHLEKWYTT